MALYSHIASELDSVERSMEKLLSQEDPNVYGVLIPFIKRGGKRIRPALCIISCGATGGKYSDCLDAAAIIELFHNFTLIHDDIEDNSDFRRGEPTLHVSHGLAMALNCGDALYTFLLNKMVELDIRPSKLIALQKLYLHAFKNLVDGQGTEITWIKSGRFDISEEDYLRMISGKTSALLALSCETGAFFSGASKSTRNRLSRYGEKLGLAFQIHDDILNITGSFDKYKKEIGGDISEGKRTLMVVHCLSCASATDKTKLTTILSSNTKKREEINEAIDILNRYGSIDYAKKIADKMIREAKDYLKPLPESKDKQSLLAIADYVVTREE